MTRIKSSRNQIDMKALVLTGVVRMRKEMNKTERIQAAHRLKSLRKEGKDFARVGWILDYGLPFREEKGGQVGKENN